MISLVDCNSCFASCEQVFRPDLRHKPLIVLSNNDGCIVARSKEAKALGIPDLQPYFKVKSQLIKNNVHVFSANFRLYGDLSNQVMATLRDFSPNVEQYSIDEMFLNFNGMDNLEDYGKRIKATLWQHVRMPVSVGIAPTKTLSKLANYAAKNMKASGVAILDTPIKWHWLQKRLSVNKIWGIGSKLSIRLNRLGIYTAYELAHANPKNIKQFTNINVERTIAELNGEQCFELDENPAHKKSIFVTRSFGTKTSSKEELLRHISRYAAAACEKLRQQNDLCQTLYIFAETSRFNAQAYANSMSIKLPYPSNDSQLIIEHAKRGINALYKEHILFAKCGVGLLDIRDKRFYQSDLFTQGQCYQSEQLMLAIDNINTRFGRDSLIFGAEGTTGKWTMNQNKLSPAYTSSWIDLPIINC